VILTRRRHH